MKVIKPDLYIGMLLVQIQIPFSRSLKDKRHVVRSITDRVRNRWNISTADIGPHNSWGDVFICFTLADSSSEQTRKRLEAVLSFLCKMEDRNGFTVINKWLEVDSYE